MHTPRLLLAALLLVVCSSILAADPVTDTPGRQVWTVPVVAGVPEAEALARGGDWPGASALTGLLELGSGELSASQPVFWLGLDKVALTVAWRVPRLEGKPFRGAATARDGAVWDDDSIEVFLDPTHSHRDYIQLIVSCRGTLYDARGRDSGWTSNVGVQVAEARDAWAGVLRVPLADLGVTTPAPGEVWAANLVVDRSAPQRPALGSGWEAGPASWVSPGSTLHEPARFGHLLPGRPAVRLTSLGDPVRRDLRPAGQLPGTGAVEVADASGAPVWRQDLTATFDVTAPALRPGGYQLRFRAQDDAGLLAATTMPLSARPAFELLPQARALAGTLQVAGRWNERDIPAAAQVRVRLLGPGLRAVRSGLMQMQGGRSVAPVEWPVGDLAPGRYTLAADLPGKSGERPRTLGRLRWEMPERPAWLGTPKGLFGDEVVLKPWTPLTVTGTEPLAVDCLGRHTVFGTSGLPAQVVASGEELLQSPVRWVGRAAGKDLQWRPEPTSLRKQAAGAVEFEADAAGGQVRMACQARIEFDGFLKLDFTLTPQGKATTLDQLQLEVPFRREIARLMHFWPVKPVWVSVDMKDFNARAVPDTPLAFPFTYHMWIGDEERGLQWLCEGAQGWRPADPDKALEVIPGAEATVLRLNVIGKPTRLDGPLHYTFMFQASPVKPTPADYRQWHYAQVASYGIQTQPNPRMARDRNVSYQAAGNFPLRRGTVEITVLPTFDSQAPGEENRQLFAMVWPEDKREEPEAGVWLYWNQDDRGMRVVVREDNQYRVVHGAPFAWRAGEPHTVAFSWGDEGRIFVDGRQLTTIPDACALRPTTDLSRAIVRLGGRDSDFVVRQVRICDEMLPAKQLGVGAAPLQASESTVLLDRFGDIQGAGGERVSVPERAAEGTLGTLTEPVTVVDGALDLSRQRVEGTTLDYLQSLGLRWLGFHEHWTDWQGFPRTSHTEELRQLLDAVHARDMKLLLYHAWQISDKAPEYPLYLAECEVIHPLRFLYTRQPPQTDYPMCPRSAWHDFMVDGIGTLFDESGPDGIYSDGLAYPAECMNELHGCGYLGEDGKRHPTFSLLAVRDVMKRVRYLMEQQGKPMLFVAHTSGSICLPTLAFADAYLDAEHLTGQPRPFRMPLDVFRAEFMGHNFGIPAYFLAYDWQAGMTSDEALALALLHDTEVPWSFEHMAPVWKLWNEWRVEEARFLGYWKAEGWLKEAPPGVRVSLYCKPNGDVLVVAANLTEDPVTGTLRLGAPLVGVQDVMAHRYYETSDGSLYDQFPPQRVRLYTGRVTDASQLR